MTATRPIGVQRDSDDMLSLDAAAIERRYQMIGMARCLIRACLVGGNAAPNTVAIRDRVLRPETGDLVVETSSVLYGKAEDRYRGFGVLLEKRREGMDGLVYYVQYGPQPEDVCRWTNADFYAIPTEISDTP